MGKFKKFSTVLAAPVIALGLAAANPAQAVPVALELSLVVDTSGSVNATEYTRQYQGYVNAFNDTAIQTAIANSVGGIAVNFIRYGSTASQQLGWTHLTNATEAGAFATAIQGLFTPNVTSGSGGTNIASGINLAVSGIGSNNFEGDRLVIDVSGDGEQNRSLTGGSISTVAGIPIVQAARNAAAGAGITINGLPILTDVATLDDYYTDNVVTADGFVLPAANFDSFETAVNQKIIAEITNTPIPEPGMIAIFVLGVAGLALRRRMAA
tara:strand:+ start:227 stop:1030 length:804 start_codon:yes stop_codon:yes gene_type:complete